MEELTNTQFPQYEKGGHVQHNAIQRNRGILLGRMVQEHLPIYTNCKTFPTSLLTTWPLHIGLHHVQSAPLLLPI